MTVTEKIISILLNLRKGRPSFSQDGEDITLYCLFEEMHISKGFYVDIGAHHPFRYSNTYLFYQKGWTGINVEPTPGRIKLFHQFRSDDINLDVGIGQSNSTMDFYCFQEPALNTFDQKTKIEREHEGFSVIKTISVPVISLDNLLNKYLPQNKKINFMTIDAEGMDLEILKTNDWKKFRPTLLVVEDSNYSFEQPDKSEIYRFLKTNSYSIVSKLQRSAIYKDAYAR